MSRLSALPARFSLRRLSLRLRIVLAVALVQGTALALTVAPWLGNARANLEEETAAALSLARTLVLATVATLHEAVPVDQIATHLPLRLAQPRHVQIAGMDAQSAILPPLTPLDRRSAGARVVSGQPRAAVSQRDRAAGRARHGGGAGADLDRSGAASDRALARCAADAGRSGRDGAGAGVVDLLGHGARSCAT